MNAILSEQSITYIGIAVTTDALEAELDGKSYITLNVPEGRARLIAYLDKQKGPLYVVCEAVGGAEAPIVQDLLAAGFTVGIASASTVCTSARLDDAAEITPAILARYGSQNAEMIKFVAGRQTASLPRMNTCFAAVSQVSRKSKRVSTWTMIAGWLNRRLLWKSAAG